MILHSCPCRRIDRAAEYDHLGLDLFVVAVPRDALHVTSFLPEASQHDIFKPLFGRQLVYFEFYGPYRHFGALEYGTAVRVDCERQVTWFHDRPLSQVLIELPVLYVLNCHQDILCAVSIHLYVLNFTVWQSMAVVFCCLRGNRLAQPRSLSADAHI